MLLLTVPLLLKLCDRVEAFVYAEVEVDTPVELAQ
jgi:hypothetical protein